MNKKLINITEHCKSLKTLQGIRALLSWDQETYMPASAIQARADHLSLISKLHHQSQTSASFIEDLSKLVDLDTGECVETSLNEEERLCVKEIYRDWQRAQALPNDFVARFSQQCSKAQHVWQEAREKNDFNLFEPYLETVVSMSKEKAEYLGWTTCPYDTLLDEFEVGMTIETLTPLFLDLGGQTKDILSDYATKTVSGKSLDGYYDIQKQWDLSNAILKKIGFDFAHGRLDKSTHPFSTNLHPTDVRITTRFKETNFLESLSSTLHEAGHAMYEQGLDPTWIDTPLGESVSLGIHESQSRFWENMIGRSYAFLKGQLPLLQQLFPSPLSGMSAEALFCQVNTIEPSVIRVEADELTYNLHILIRFEIEKQLFSDKITVKELPDLWEALYQKYLGVSPKTMAEGVLQDVHWSAGLFGYFPTYALGNLYAAQFYDQLRKELPAVEHDVEVENFAPIKEWLRTNIYQKGRMETPQNLIKTVTGRALSVQPFISYIRNKYDALHQLDVGE